MLSPQATPISHTHSTTDKLTKDQINHEINEIKARLTSQFSSEPPKLEALLGLLESLSQFELGRFLIKNKGALSGYWTWYVISEFQHQDIDSPLEKFILEKSPAILATRERFYIFQNLLKKYISSNNVICSIPCGMMADLLTLDLPDTIQEVRFVGIDLDDKVFNLAKDLQQKSKSHFDCEFFTKNAWQLEEENKFDVITSNGLNVYEKDNDKVVALYRSFYRALKPNGKLICSALTHPPGGAEKSEWNMDTIDQQDMIKYGSLIKIILNATWTNFRSSEQTCQQLKEAGFEEIEIHWDSRRIFPSFCATKK